MQDGMTAEVHVCDYAAVADGKLTMVGGGFDWINLQAPTAPAVFGVGIFLHVPWTETNRRHSSVIRLVDGDGRPHLDPAGQPVRIEGQFEVGRPPGIPAGSSSTVPQAFNFAGLPLHADATYVVELLVDGGSAPVATARFQTRHAPQAPR